jgi:hypothetical protein
MLLIELFSFVPYAGIFILEFVHWILEFGLISLVIGGPAMLLFLLTLRSIIGSVFFIFFGIPTLIASVLWIGHLPFVIIEYDPTILEFLAIYLPSLLFVSVVCYNTIKWSKFPERNPPRIHLHQD